MKKICAYAYIHMYDMYMILHLHLHSQINLHVKTLYLSVDPNKVFYKNYISIYMHAHIPRHYCRWSYVCCRISDQLGFRTWPSPPHACPMPNPPVLHITPPTLNPKPQARQPTHPRTPPNQMVWPPLGKYNGKSHMQEKNCRNSYRNWTKPALMLSRGLRSLENWK